MKRSIIAAFVAMATMTSVNANAEQVHNGLSLNAVSFNGISLNAATFNAATFNAATFNAVSFNGMSLQGSDLQRNIYVADQDRASSVSIKAKNGQLVIEIPSAIQKSAE